jgi:hypothetical protein
VRRPSARRRRRRGAPHWRDGRAPRRRGLSRSLCQALSLGQLQLHLQVAVVLLAALGWG